MSDAGISTGILVVTGIIVVWLCILLPNGMARKRHRNGLGWVTISLVFSPIVAIVGLLVLGQNWEYHARKERQGDD